MTILDNALIGAVFLFYKIINCGIGIKVKIYDKIRKIITKGWLFTSQKSSTLFNETYNKY